MNAFARHGIDHLSASSLNLFAAEPALWVVTKLLKRPIPGGLAAQRGKAIERGVALGLFDPSLTVAQCQAEAEAEFDALSAFAPPAERAKAREVVAPTVAAAIAELRQYGIPTAPAEGERHRIELRLPEIPVPLIGYLDFLFDAHGIVVDLKTSTRIPAEISPAQARQGAVYVAGTNRQMRFAYATPKRVAVYALENPALHLAALGAIAQRLGRFLATSADPEALAAIVCPDFEDFRWSDAGARAIGREVFGF
jgi:hypothetical protein